MKIENDKTKKDNKRFLNCILKKNCKINIFIYDDVLD